MPKQYMEMELQVPSGSPINNFGQIRSGLVGASGSEVKSLNPVRSELHRSRPTK